MTILVTGATGNVGRLVVDHLLAAGATDIRALTNNPTKAALPTHVEVLEGYLGRLETMPAALEGVDRMYLAPVPRTVREVVSLARGAGVKHIVDLSGPAGTLWHSVEVAVEDSGIDWTHLEAGEFMTNATIWAEQIRTTDLVKDAYPNAANAPIAPDDIAAVAATVLLEESYKGRALELTGPETITRAEMVRLIGEALGRAISFVELSHEQAVEELTPVMGGETARWFVDGRAMLAEYPQRAVPTVEEITRRVATTFAQWARANVDEFR